MEGQIRFKMAPKGNKGSQPLACEFILNDQFPSIGIPGTDQPVVGDIGASMDWYNGKLQIVVDDNDNDSALHIRFYPDGTIAEIMVRDRELLKLCFVEGGTPPSKWHEERDAE